MEDIGDIKAMRKNLMIVSLTVLFLLLFCNEITEINLGLIKFNQVNIFSSIKIILLLLLANGFVLWRYLQYKKYLTEKPCLKLHALELIKGEKFTLYTGDLDELDSECMTENADIQSEFKNDDLILCSTPLSFVAKKGDKNTKISVIEIILGDFLINDNIEIAKIDTYGTRCLIIIRHEKKKKCYRIEIQKTRIKVLLNGLRYLLKEKFFWDYELPIVFGFWAIISLLLNAILCISL